MNTNELSAKYIYEDKERLQMALHVYEAMPTVRTYLIKGIFKAVGDHVAERLDGVELDNYEDSVYFWTEESDEFYVFAAVRDKRGISRLVAGVYVYDVKSVRRAKRDAIKNSFETTVNLETWFDGEIHSSNTEIAYTNVYAEREDDFLRRAIQCHDEVVSDVAGVLVRIYEGVRATIAHPQ